MHKAVRIGCMMALLGVTPAYAVNYIQSHIPNMKMVGKGRLSVFLFNVYDAELYAANGQWTGQPPYALKLSYLRDVSGKKIADRSTEEIRDLGYKDEIRLADWHNQMRDIFPDVKEGDTLTGVYTEQRVTVFYKGKEEIGRIADPEFGEKFFDIWLNEDTSAPELRRKLLGSS